jgi:hypothetical protein
VIDTETIIADAAVLQVLPQVEEEMTIRDVQLSSKVRVLFSRQALIELLRAEGFTDIAVLAPAPGMPAEYYGYGQGIRLSMIARRSRLAPRDEWVHRKHDC